MLNVLNHLSRAQVETQLKLAGLPVPEDDAALNRLFVKAVCGSTQGTVAAAFVNATGGSITADELVSVLQDAFPNDKIGKRHGGHYLSKCRTGKITVAVEVPKATRTAVLTAKNAEIEALKAELAKLKAKPVVETE